MCAISSDEDFEPDPVTYRTPESTASSTKVSIRSRQQRKIKNVILESDRFVLSQDRTGKKKLNLIVFEMLLSDF